MMCGGRHLPSTRLSQSAYAGEHCAKVRVEHEMPTSIDSQMVTTQM